MKYLRIVAGIVTEIIQAEDPTFPGVPITARYAPDFLTACDVVDDIVDVHPGYIKTDVGFAPPPIQDPDDGAILDTPTGTPEPTLRDRLAQLENYNATLSAKLDAAIQSNDFLEGCIVEMAQIVYA